MISDDQRWSAMISDDQRWSAMISDDQRWSAMICVEVDHIAYLAPSYDPDLSRLSSKIESGHRCQFYENCSTLSRDIVVTMWPAGRMRQRYLIRSPTRKFTGLGLRTSPETYNRRIVKNATVKQAIIINHQFTADSINVKLRHVSSADVHVKNVCRRHAEVTI